MKSAHLPDRTLLWLIAFIVFATSCIVLFIILKPWILKILFLLLGLGAAGYSWVIMESRRITYTHNPDVSTAASPPDAAEEEAERETATEAEAEEELLVADDQDEQAAERLGAENGTVERAPPDAPEEGAVYVSDKGDKYHLDRQCVGLRFADKVETMGLQEAVSLNRKPCSKCRAKAGE